jgi:hypothetical protein
MGKYDFASSDDEEYESDDDVAQATTQVVVKMRRSKPSKPKTKPVADKKTRKRYPKTHVLKKGFTTSHKYSESFDADKLHYILSNRDKFELAEYDVEESQARKRYMESCFGKDYDPFLMAEKYLKRSKDGKLEVIYKRNRGLGRAHAIGGVSQQGMPIEIRHTIAATFYQDVDMVNAHPTFLLYLSTLRRLDTPVLKRYVENREAILKEVCSLTGISRGLAKIIFLCLLNGGTRDYKKLETKPLVLTDFMKEMFMIHHEFTKDKEYPEHVKRLEARGKTFNQAASYVNTLLCDLEHIMLMDALDYIKQGTEDREDSYVLVFDGLQCPLHMSIDLPGLSSHIKDKRGIDVKFAIKPMDQGYKIPNIIPKYMGAVIESAKNSFDYDDEYTYQSFHNEFRESKWKSKQDLDEALQEKYPKIIAKVLNGEGSLIKKGEEGTYDMVKKLGMSGFSMYYSKPDGKRIKISFKDYMKSQEGFGRYECKLGKSTGKNFNVWSGFGAKRTDKNTEGCEAIKKFILEVWANSNPVYYKFIISWMAGIFTNLEGINKTALALVSQQGCGKNFITGFLSKLVRQINVIEVVGVKPITQKHNAILSNKRLIVVNEMASTRKEFKSAFENMKALITEPYVNIDPKGSPVYKIDNVGNYILCTNNADSIIVEKTDRRYTIFELNAKYRGNVEFFESLAALAFNQETYDAFYTFLMDFDAVDVSKPIETSIKKDIAQLSMSAPVKFIETLREGTQYTSEDLIKSNVLYDLFSKWAEDNGENTCSSRKFILSVRGEVIRVRKSKGVFYRISAAQ